MTEAEDTAQDIPDLEASLIEEALKQEIENNAAQNPNEADLSEVSDRPAGQQWPVCTP